MDGCDGGEFDSFFVDAESQNDAPLIVAMAESAPVCLKRPPQSPVRCVVTVIADYRLPFPVSIGGNPKQATGPPDLWRIAA